MPSSVLHTVDDVSIDVRALRARTSRSGTMCVQEPQLHGRVLRFVYVSLSARCTWPRAGQGHIRSRYRVILRYNCVVTGSLFMRRTPSCIGFFDIMLYFL